MAYVKAHETKQRKNGKPVLTYRVIWREQVRDAFGLPLRQTRNRTETYPTREQAQARADELNAVRHTTGTSALAEQRRAGEQPLGYYARAWLDAQAVKVSQGKLKQRTVDEYARLLRCYVLPDLGGLAVASITPAHCEQFLAALVRQQSRQGNRAPLTPGTVKHAWDMLRRVLRYALQHGALTANPAERVDFSANRAIGDRSRFEHYPLTAGQVGALSAAIAGTPPADYIGPALPAYPVYGLMVEFMAYTGLRASEVTGLEVQDVVFTPGANAIAPPCRCAARRIARAGNG